MSHVSHLQGPKKTISPFLDPKLWDRFKDLPQNGKICAECTWECRACCTFSLALLTLAHAPKLVVY